MSRPLIIGAMQSEIDILQNELVDFDVIKTGIGMANTILNLNDFLNDHKPQFMVNVGVVGVFAPKIKIGDIIIPNKIYNGNCFRAKNGDIHRKELMHWVEGEADYKQPALFADEKLQKKFIKFFEDQKINFYRGAVASGGMWNSDVELLENLRLDYEIVCEDMEAWSAAFLCKKHQIPFATIKIVSNNNLYDSEKYDNTVGEILQNSLVKLLKGGK